MFLRFIKTKISNNHKLLSLSNLTLFYQPIIFWEKCTLPNYLENKQNSDPRPFCKMGEDPAIINQNYLFYIFVTTNKASNNKNT